MRDSKLAKLSISFAVDTLKLLETVKGHFALVNQLERSATSVGANIHEANYAQSKADFISKLRIALKECYETEYWFQIFSEAGLLPSDSMKTLIDQCRIIRHLLISSINTANKQQTNSK